MIGITLSHRVALLPVIGYRWWELPLYLSLHDRRRARKSFDWNTTNRLHAKGLLENPRNKNKSVVLTDEGLAAARAACVRLFGEED